MKRGLQVLISVLVAVAVIGAFVWGTQGRDIPVLQPHGTIADQQFILILITVGLGFFVVVPVFILLFSMAWHFRAGNEKAKYEPDMKGRLGLELLWWGIPCAIILTLAIVTYVSTHALDPFKPLQSDRTPVKVQVVSLDWNWLFIYPDKGVATLNYMNIPANTPIDLTLTSDAPMNTFWVPALAGQIYTMSGMSSQLHFMADSTGTFNGATANISGKGYADMTFKVHAVNDADFSTWLTQAAASPNVLTNDAYTKLSQPTDNQPATTYKLDAPNLFDTIIMKYMNKGAGQ